MSEKAARIPLTDYQEYPPDEMLARAESFYAELRRRRTVREFSDRPVDQRIIEYALLAAGTAPNGANMQPWQFVVVSDPERKRRLRERGEEIEKDFYERRISDEWRSALAPLGTDAHKPYLETAPYLIAIFEKRATILSDGEKKRNYYTPESVGIATGMLITALHHAGLVTLTHTPSPMGWLNEVLERPKNERAYLLLITGYPAPDVTVPAITKKPLDEIALFI